MKTMKGDVSGNSPDEQCTGFVITEPFSFDELDGIATKISVACVTPVWSIFGHETFKALRCHS